MWAACNSQREVKPVIYNENKMSRVYVDVVDSHEKLVSSVNREIAIFFVMLKGGICLKSLNFEKMRYQLNR